MPSQQISRDKGPAQAIVQTCADPTAQEEAQKEKSRLAHDPKLETHMQFGVACGDRDLDHGPAWTFLAALPVLIGQRMQNLVILLHCKST